MYNWKKNIILYLTSQTISLLGSSLVQYAIIWYITLETKSGLMVTISILCGFLPTLLLSPFAGVWADRHNRKLLIMLSDSVIALSTLIMTILFMLGYKYLWLIFVISSIRAFGTAVQTPASSSLVPSIVPVKHLTRINGINSSLLSAAMIISPAISGVLMTIIPIHYIFLIDVVTAIIGVSILGFFVKVPLHVKVEENQNLSYLGDMKQGFSYIKNHSYLMTFFLFISIMMFLIATPAFLTPLQITRSFGGEVWRLSAVEICFSLGMMLGGLFMAIWGGFKNKMYTIIIADVILGCFTIALGVTSNFYIYLFFVAVIGVSITMSNTPTTVLIQEKVEANYLGRVFSVLTMVNSSMMPLGMVIFGPLSDFISIEKLLIITGFLTLIECFFMYRQKILVNAGESILNEA
ncbi:MAG: MFS transporter [Solirubrobacterales bacterium]